VKPSAATTRSVKPDDTQNADADTMEALKAKYAKLNEKQLDYVKHFTSLANQAGHNISLQQTPSVRRFNIATAIIDFSETEDRDMLVTALNTISDQPDTGTQLGLLTSTQAIELKTIASHLLSGDPVEITSNNTIKLLEGNQ
jgi:phage I-like protein